MKKILSIVTVTIITLVSACTTTTLSDCGCKHSGTKSTCAENCECGCRQGKECNCAKDCKCAKHATKDCDCNKK